MLKNMLHGPSDLEPQTDNLVIQLLQELCNAFQCGNEITGNSRKDFSKNLVISILKYAVIY